MFPIKINSITRNSEQFNAFVYKSINLRKANGLRQVGPSTDSPNELSVILLNRLHECIDLDFLPISVIIDFWDSYNICDIVKGHSLVKSIAIPLCNWWLPWIRSRRQSQERIYHMSEVFNVICIIWRITTWARSRINRSIPVLPVPSNEFWSFHDTTWRHKNFN